MLNSRFFLEPFPNAKHLVDTIIFRSIITNISIHPPIHPFHNPCIHPCTHCLCSHRHTSTEKTPIIGTREVVLFTESSIDSTKVAVVTHTCSTHTDSSPTAQQSTPFITATFNKCLVRYQIGSGYTVRFWVIMAILCLSTETPTSLLYSHSHRFIKPHWLNHHQNR